MNPSPDCLKLSHYDHNLFRGRTTLWPLKSREKKSPRKKDGLFLVVTTGTQALTLARLPRRDFLWLCQPPGCTKQLFRVEAA